MNLSRQTGTPATRGEHIARPLPGSLRGVYRFRHRVGGCPAWYSLDDDGDVLDFEVVRPGMSEADVVSRQAELAYGEDGVRPILRLHKPDDVPISRPGVAGGARLRFSPALCARIYRARLAASPGRSRP